MSPDLNNAATKYVLDWLNLQQRLGDHAGLQAAVAHHGRPVGDVAAGWASERRGEKLTRDHRFRVASHSKSFTAVGIMKLVDLGRVRLDDHVGRYLSSLHPDTASATIAQLLSHTAGVVRDGADAGQWQHDRPFLDAAELKTELADTPVLTANTRFKYSNHGIGLAGLVIEAVTGEPYAAWMARMVVAASGLTMTAPDMPSTLATPLADAHGPKLLTGKRFGLPMTQPTNALAPATGFVSTARDLAAFFASIDPAAETSILSKAARRDMTRRQWRVPDTVLDQHYGLGLMQGGTGAWQWFGHSGVFPGCLSHTRVFPDHGLTLSIIVNSGELHPIVLADGATEIFRTFASGGAPDAKLKDWTGRWWTPWAACDLVALGAKVYVANPALLNPLMDASEVDGIAGDRGRIAKATGYMAYGEPAALIRDDQGRVTSLKLGGVIWRREAEVAARVKRGFEE